MPCTAKKRELGRDHQNAAGVPDVDFSLTSRELARMIQKCNISFPGLVDEEFDAPLGIGSGAGTIFGATGGVMEAALRTANDWLNGEPQAALDFSEVRGVKGVKEATYTVIGKAFDGSWDEMDGAITLGINEDAVGLPVDTWSLEGFTIEDYEALKAAVVAGDVVIDDQAAENDPNAKGPWSNVTVDYVE
jgi:hypothetical protein